MSWLPRLNRALLALLIPICLFWVWTWFGATPELVWSPPSEESKSLPKSPFALEEEAYRTIGPPVIQNNFAPLTPQLPDLSKIVHYFGRNGRPDGGDDQQVYIGLKGLGRNQDFRNVSPGGKAYLTYNKIDARRGEYKFTPEGEQTKLWLELDVEGEKAQISVMMLDSDGKILAEPESHRSFSLEERELPRVGTQRWDLDGQRVDGSLLVRQRARWYGSDLFLKQHGGKEFESLGDRYRIRFGEGDAAYYRFVEKGSSLVWKDKKWEALPLGPETRGKPLLYLKKVDERMLHFDLWDPEGRIRTPINLIKTTEVWRFPGKHKMKFIGPRTRTQSIVEFDDQRLVLGPQEWILYDAKDGWRLLRTETDIDAYVAGEVDGELFVADEVVKIDGQSALRGHVFSRSRANVKAIDLLPDGTIKSVEAQEEPIEEIRLRPGVRPTEGPGSEPRENLPRENFPVNLPPGLKDESGKPDLKKLKEYRDAMKNMNIPEGRLPPEGTDLEGFQGILGR